MPPSTPLSLLSRPPAASVLMAQERGPRSTLADASPGALKDTRRDTLDINTPPPLSSLHSSGRPSCPRLSGRPRGRFTLLSRPLTSLPTYIRNRSLRLSSFPPLPAQCAGADVADDWWLRPLLRRLTRQRQLPGAARGRPLARRSQGCWPPHGPWDWDREGGLPALAAPEGRPLRHLSRGPPARQGHLGRDRAWKRECGAPRALQPVPVTADQEVVHGDRVRLDGRREREH
eukprot:scaffold82530_cov33-Tisochrysis_lutea.AAC.2